MPELPEVEVVRAGLAKTVVGGTIRSVEIIGALGARSIRRHTQGPADFCAVLRGRTIIDVRRRGKYLWFVLDGGDALLAHLGMSGQFRVQSVAGGLGGPDGGAAGVGGVVAGPDGGAAGPDGGAVRAADRHLRVLLGMTGQRGDFALKFCDQRTFGGLMFVPGGADLPDPIAHIALDPLDPHYDAAATARRIRAKRTAIKRVLLDQTIVSGIGNIYADEALWAARVRYDRATDGLAARSVVQVLDAAASVMRRALAEGGTSFDSLYVNVNGESGYFERSLQAYGREGLPCRRCGGPIRRAPFMNRSSFYCPRRQPAGRK